MIGHIVRIQHANERNRASLLIERAHGCLHANVTEANRRRYLYSQRSLENVEIKVPHVVFSAHDSVVFAFGSLFLLKAHFKLSILSENGRTLCDR
jgi:hypothetical protein